MWEILVALVVIALTGWVMLPAVLVFLGVRFARKRKLIGGRGDRPRLGGGSGGVLAPAGARTGCPARERETLTKLEKRLEVAHAQCEDALETRLTSELARARIAPPLEDAYAQIKTEVESIWAFCQRNDLVGTLKKANTSTTAQDIYLQAYQRDLAKVQAALEKTEECLAAYERTVATLEVSSVSADIDSDFDASIQMLRDLRDELPQYNLEDRI